MKKLAIAIASVGMMTVFSACGDDSSSSESGLLSCEINMSMSIPTLADVSARYCAEVGYTSETNESLNEECTSEEYEEDGFPITITAKKGTGCPSGYVLKCDEVDEDGNEGSVYFYDKAKEGMTCEEAIGDIF